MFIKISQNSQENTRVGVSFLIKLQAAYNFIKKETLTQVFSCEFCEIFKNTILTEHLPATASSNSLFLLCSKKIILYVLCKLFTKQIRQIFYCFSYLTDNPWCFQRNHIASLKWVSPQLNAYLIAVILISLCPLQERHLHCVKNKCRL